MISAALAAGLALTMTVTAFADEPYTAYNYDYWDDAIPSQSAYRVEKTVTGADMGLSGCAIQATTEYSVLILILR